MAPQLNQSGNPVLSAFRNQPRALAGQRMTLQGAINKSFLLLVVLMLGALYPWTQFDGDPASVQGMMMLGVIGGFVLALIIAFNVTMAPYLAIPYAALEGLAIGGISAVFEQRSHGIAIQAVGLTFGVLATMLFLYSTRLVQVTNRFRMIVFAATGAIALMYLLNFVLAIFHIGMPILNSGGPVGIIVSLVIIGIAALNLMLDFDIIERGVASGAPRYMEWYAGFSLMVTLVWLYLEILRFLSRMRER